MCGRAAFPIGYSELKIKRGLVKAGLCRKEYLE